MRNIEWCLDFLDELNSESSSVFNETVYDHLKMAKQELIDAKTIMELPEGWHIQYNPKPIPDRNHDYDFWHDDKEIAWSAPSVQDAIEQINEIELNLE